ncbi:DUF2325 domain-containing protein [Paenibacillus periandrae]|uniref:DUF2325 domain-containing protein n=1 Tax=Paenibacillus periandrae TaxID=1761741 RepID=UPI001F09CB6C|nr:DUF2325 domain-containing protein [Paenibacillus periandrae]
MSKFFYSKSRGDGMNNMLVQNSMEILSNKVSSIDQEVINAFLESEADEYDDTKIVEVIKILEQIWSHQKYGLEEGILFSNVLDVLLHCDPNFIKKLSQSVGITITHKDIKKGKYAILSRVLRKYHNKKVRDYFSKFLEFNYRAEIATIMADSKSSLIELKSKSPFESLLWILVCQLNDEDTLNYLKETFPRDYAYSLWYCLISYIGMEFEVIMDRPNEMSQDQSNSLSSIQVENKKLQKNLDKSEKKKIQLQRTVHEKEQNEKALRGQMHDLYEDALKETEFLRHQVEQLKREHEEEILGLLETSQEERISYQQTIDNLRQLLASRSNEPVNDLNDLEGRTIAVVGGNRERHYRDIIERYNGKISFVPEDQLSLVHHSVMGSQAVFFIKGLAGHDHWRDAMDAAKTAEIPFVYVNTKGISTFERLLVQFMKQSHEMGYRIHSV